MIKCKQLTKFYQMGDQVVHALDGVDIHIDAGEMVAIVGASGSGKSTLMNILGCLDTPTSGQYFLDGHDVSHLSDDNLAEVRNRKIGFVFQQFHLLARSTALGNVEMPMLYRDDNHNRALSIDALGRVGLNDRMHHFPNQLSGGQRQRVAVARALVTQPAILLADEPTGNLDSTTTEEIMRLFKELNDQGVTLVIVTHEHEIASHCSRQIMMRDGKVIEDRRIG